MDKDSNPYQAAIRQLIEQSVAAGMELPGLDYDIRSLTDGNTADLVSEVRLNPRFVVKLDASPKVAAEGRKIREMQSDTRLSARHRLAWGKVWAIRDEAPYGYLMENFRAEDGWRSMEARLFPAPGAAPVTPAQAHRLMLQLLDCMFDSYQTTIDKRALPNLEVDLVERIRDRLPAAAAQDERFRSQILRINGVEYPGWQDYLDLIERHTDALARIAAPFSTLVHGDIHAGNVMLRVSLSEVEVRLIDPKEWRSGDYLYDIGKMLHWIQATGPIEKPSATGERIAVTWDNGAGHPRLEYRVPTPDWVAPLSAATLERVDEFALAHGDAEWLARFELTMAAALLGLPAGRLQRSRRPNPDAALALYGEGLRWLAKFCARLEPPGAEDRVAPASIRRLREQVARELPEAQPAQDRRGFQLLHWPPPRQNARGKPAELSLEHEARLTPGSAQGLAALRQALSSDSSSVPWREAGVDTLAVRRYPREPGAQSIDRYHDVPGPGSLIARMITVRERFKSSAFMTWGSDRDGPRPLNLELPFAAIGNSGVVVRLEFNWIDDLAMAMADLDAGAQQHEAWRRGPLRLAGLAAGFDAHGLVPVLEQTTFREKFSLVDEAGEERFQLNIDHVVAQSLATGRQGVFVDVDIAPTGAVDTSKLAWLERLSAALMHRYGLQPMLATKAWRGAQATGYRT